MIARTKTFRSPPGQPSTTKPGLSTNARNTLDTTRQLMWAKIRVTISPKRFLQLSAYLHRVLSKASIEHLGRQETQISILSLSTGWAVTPALLTRDRYFRSVVSQRYANRINWLSETG
jgi:hypothetical protein